MTPGTGVDPLSDGLVATDPPHILTDGEWEWPGDLPYYLEEYHVSLEREFLDRVRGNGYRVPFLSERQLFELDAALYPQEDDL